MNAPDWLAELPTLVGRHLGYGIGPDLGALTTVELWGLYCFLKRLG